MTSPQVTTTVERTVTLGDGRSFRCPEGDTLLRAALRAGLPATYECNSGGCGACKYTLSDGGVDQINPDATGLTARDKRKGKLLACQSVPLSDCAVTLTLDADWPQGRTRPQVAPATVTAIRDLTHDLREITVRTEVAAEFLPGQFAMLTLPGARPARAAERAYSMSNLANPEGIWQFQIKRVPGGAVSPRFVDAVTVGDVVTLDGPYGHAHLQPNERDVVCIAGGSGLAPMVSVARGLASRGDAASRRLDFFYGGRREEDMCAREFVDEVTPLLASAALAEAISEEPSKDWIGSRGFIHEVLAVADIPDLAERDIYVAGPPVMTDAVVRHLVLERSVPVDRVHFDRFF
ncbi:2Fe-2S iron-sulfur cluster-binding protein [Rhodococcus sp. MSC1_016]|jgi:toluene monooxygenase electron transfer component|uniref:2Fe-2S iron-sulfur cluster-binding protein n=1 Tax=Rhodococcus sp. MSC1_016 TaxID=2909266 RepID=UPI00202DEB0A|nr:2Fe-2S iron-sulfur cluster-binding protein [Rhodococcus sp. MSC1_016]